MPKNKNYLLVKKIYNTFISSKDKIIQSDSFRRKFHRNSTDGAAMLTYQILSQSSTSLGTHISVCRQQMCQKEVNRNKKR